jgi:serine phosphatase RsbU (regulator of sigma subunit)
VFYENTAENAYASLFFGAYDDSLLRYANCGHLCALLLRDDGKTGTP